MNQVRDDVLTSQKHPRHLELALVFYRLVLSPLESLPLLNNAPPKFGPVGINHTDFVLEEASWKSHLQSQE